MICTFMHILYIFIFLSAGDEEEEKEVEGAENGGMDITSDVDSDDNPVMEH